MWLAEPWEDTKLVALLAEGVGRNIVVPVGYGFTLVALLAEGVGRNLGAGRRSRDGAGRPPRGGRG